MSKLILGSYCTVHRNPTLDIVHVRLESCSVHMADGQRGFNSNRKGEIKLVLIYFRQHTAVTN